MTLPRASSEAHKSCWVLHVQLLQRSQEVDAHSTQELGDEGIFVFRVLCDLGFLKCSYGLKK